MHEELHELLSLYALGALQGPERDGLEQHLASGCAECERELFELDHAAANLAFVASPIDPPQALRDRVVSSIGLADQVRRLRVIKGSHDEGRPSKSRPVASAFAIAALLAAAAFAIVFMAWALVSSGSRLDEAVRQLADARAAEAQRQAEIDRQRQLLSLVADPAARTTELKSTTSDSGATLNVVWHPDKKRGVLVASGLANVESGKSYELWLVSGSTPVPAAVFNTDSAGNAVVAIDQLDEAGQPSVFAITVEPSSGSKLPTSKILMAGKYAGG